MSSSTSNHQISAPEQVASKMLRIEFQEVELVDISTLQHDPGLHLQMWEYPVNQHDEIRHVYLKNGPYRFIPSNSFGYPFSRKRKKSSKISIILV